MSQSFEQTFKEVFGTSPRFGMFSDKGNHAVHEIVKRAKMYRQDWPTVYAELRELAELNEDCAEALDTDVRERVYDFLGFDTPFYI